MPPTARRLQTYVDLVNSARATMWSRHNAMLVANSLILSALAISPTHGWPESPCSPPDF
jgi:hypothetical protein